MAFKDVLDLDASEAVSLGGRNKKTGKANPESVEGYYLGSRKVESKKARNGFAYLHILQTPKGNLGVWGKTDLDRKLITVIPGTMVRATHTGMIATPNGEMYKYRVEVDSDNTIDVGSLSASNESVGYDSDSTSEDTESYSTSEDSEDADQDVALELATQQAAERKAKVQALLNKNKRN